MRTILVTGVLGFIFSNFVRLPQPSDPNRNPDRLVGVDKAVHQYNLENLDDAAAPNNHSFHFVDIADKHNMRNLFELYRPSIVIGGAAESFVDDSIRNIDPFIHTNIVGTQVLIDLCLRYQARYIHISTDEVYGHIKSKDDKAWVESDPLNPRNPYSASKACAEHIVRAAHNTHGLNFNIVRPCNTFGPRQKDANLIPMIIRGWLTHHPITLHGNGDNFRQYLFVEDLCEGLWKIVEKGAPAEVYNIGANNYYTNREMVDVIGGSLSKSVWPPPTIKHITDRKAHDFGYSVNSDKIRELGWEPKVDFKQAMKQTVSFYERKWKQ